jgi:hypothetical protein
MTFFGNRIMPSIDDAVGPSFRHFSLYGAAFANDHQAKVSRDSSLIQNPTRAQFITT